MSQYRETYYDNQIYIDQDNRKLLLKGILIYSILWFICCFLYSEMYIAALNLMAFKYLKNISSKHKGKLRLKISKGAGGFFPSYVFLAILFIDVGMGLVNVSLESYKRVLKGSAVNYRPVTDNEEILKNTSIIAVRSYQMISTMASGVVLRYVDSKFKKSGIDNKYLGSLRCKFKQRAGQKIKSKLDQKHIDIEDRFSTKYGILISTIIDVSKKIQELFLFNFIWEKIEVSSCKNI